MADYTDDENASTGQSSSLSEVSGSAKSLVGKQNAKLKAKAKEAGQKLKKNIGKSIKEGFKVLLRTPHGWIVILIICLLIFFLAIVLQTTVKYFFRLLAKSMVACYNHNWHRRMQKMKVFAVRADLYRSHTMNEYRFERSNHSQCIRLR